MCITLQVQTEMADIVGLVDGLRLGAQHDVVHHLFMRGAFGMREDAVEHRGLHHLSLGERDADGLQIIGEGVKLFLAGLFMDTIDQGLARLLKRFRSRDVRHDHEFFDQAHGFEALLKRNRLNFPIAADDDAALRQIQIKR